jgi:hypothetical protein
MIADLRGMAKKLKVKAGPGDGGLVYLRSLASLYESMAEGFAQRFTA